MAKDFFYQPEPHLEEKYGHLLVVALPHLKSWPISNQRESKGRGGEGEGLLQKRSIFLAFDLGARMAKDFFYQRERRLEEKYGHLLINCIAAPKKLANLK